MKTSFLNDFIVKTPKWVLFTCFWCVQAVILYFGQAFLYSSQAPLDVDLSQPRTLGFIPHGFFGVLPSWEDYLDLMTTREFVIPMLITIAVLTLAQMIFIMPVRRPGLVQKRGKSLRKSLIIAGGIISTLAFGALIGIAGFLDTIADIDPPNTRDFPGDPYTTFGIIIAFGWIIATPLLIVFCKTGRKEHLLSKLANRIFLGTMIEIALLIPLDVMVRRKESCYCVAGTYWALTVCGFIGVFALGPAVFLPILSKRRKTWYGGHCGVCGYDMEGMITAARCPECGTGWRQPQEPKTT